MVWREVPRRLAQGSARQSTGRVDSRQWRIGFSEQQRDLRAPEDDRIAPSTAQRLDYASEVSPGALFEPAAHQLFEDHGVDPFAIMRLWNVARDADGRKLLELDGPLHQVSRSENAQPLELLRRSEAGDFFGDVEPLRRRLRTD